MSELYISAFRLFHRRISDREIGEDVRQHDGTKSKELKYVKIYAPVRIWKSTELKASKIGTAKTSMVVRIYFRRWLRNL